MRVRESERERMMMMMVVVEKGWIEEKKDRSNMRELLSVVWT